MKGGEGLVVKLLLQNRKLYCTSACHARQPMQWKDVGLIGMTLQISLLIDQFDKLFYNYLLHIPILFTS